MEKRIFSDHQSAYVIRATCDIPIDRTRYEQKKFVYYYVIESADSQCVVENYLAEKKKIRYLELEKFLPNKSPKYTKKSKTKPADDTTHIDVIDDVILFGEKNSYKHLNENGMLINLYNIMFKLYLELDIFSPNNQATSNFQSLKRFINVNKCMCNEANDYHTNFKDIFNTVLKNFIT